MESGTFSFLGWGVSVLRTARFRYLELVLKFERFRSQEPALQLVFALELVSVPNLEPARVWLEALITILPVQLVPVLNLRILLLQMRKIMRKIAAEGEESF